MDYRLRIIDDLETQTPGPAQRQTKPIVPPVGPRMPVETQTKPIGGSRGVRRPKPVAPNKPNLPPGGGRARLTLREAAGAGRVKQSQFAAGTMASTPDPARRHASWLCQTNPMCWPVAGGHATSCRAGREPGASNKPNLPAGRRQARASPGGGPGAGRVKQTQFGAGTTTGACLLQRRRGRRARQTNPIRPAYSRPRGAARRRRTKPISVWAVADVGTRRAKTKPISGWRRETGGRSGSSYGLQSSAWMRQTKPIWRAGIVEIAGKIV